MPYAVKERERRPYNKSANIRLIRSEMRDRGYIQRDLANLLGLSPTTISFKMAGLRKFSVGELRRIADWLEIEDMNELL